MMMMMMHTREAAFSLASPQGVFLRAHVAPFPLKKAIYKHRPPLICITNAIYSIFNPKNGLSHRSFRSLAANLLFAGGRLCRRRTHRQQREAWPGRTSRRYPSTAKWVSNRPQPQAA
jgi:hypothetical protein